MYRKADGQLAAYNVLAQHYQDEAYTLAYYLLGNEEQAAEATQAAFANLYQFPEMRVEKFRYEALKGVLAHCRHGGGMYPPRAGDGITQQLLQLREDQRCALVLVDVLGLDYPGAALVLNCSSHQIGKLLAQGRLNIARQPAAATQPVRVY